MNARDLKVTIVGKRAKTALGAQKSQRQSPRYTDHQNLCFPKITRGVYWYERSGMAMIRLRNVALLGLSIIFGSTLLFGQTTPSSTAPCFASHEPAQCELQTGIDSFRSANYEQAAEHFRRAIEHDHGLLKAHLYLGTSLAQQFVPGLDTPPNNIVSQEAIAEFSTVLSLHPNHDDELVALRNIASLYFESKNFSEAKGYYLKVIDLDPNDAESYYTIGVIEWTRSYKARMEAYNKLGLTPPTQRLDTATCNRLAAEYLPEVEDGMQMLIKALELRPDSDDAMAYMNLLYRERADLQCTKSEARKRDLAEADRWVDLTIATKKAKVEESKTQPLKR